jgi:hypothetical protein
MDAEKPQESQGHGVFQSTVDLLVERARAVADLVAAAGGGVLGALPSPLPAPVGHLLASLRQLVDQMPQVSAEFEVLVNEIHAKRLSIQALQAELTVLDDQLAVLEKSLAPLQAWNRQWGRVRSALAEATTLPGG